MDTVMIAPFRGEEVEVLANAKRRRFTLEYKRGILREAERCCQPGELGALLRREGLYSSHLSVWRAARERGEIYSPIAQNYVNMDHVTVDLNDWQSPRPWWRGLISSLKCNTELCRP